MVIAPGIKTAIQVNGFQTGEIMTDTELPPRPLALRIAARCWCDPETSGKVMDHTLATAFAKRVDILLQLVIDRSNCINAAKHLGLAGEWLDRANDLASELEQVLFEVEPVLI